MVEADEGVALSDSTSGVNKGCRPPPAGRDLWEKKLMYPVYYSSIRVAAKSLARGHRAGHAWPMYHVHKSGALAEEESPRKQLHW